MVGSDGIEPLAEAAVLQTADPTIESNTALKNNMNLLFSQWCP